jgi:hypothetical protein
MQFCEECSLGLKLIFLRNHANGKIKHLIFRRLNCWGFDFSKSLAGLSVQFDA